MHASFRPIAVGVLVLGVTILGAPSADATNGYLIHGIGTRAKALAGAGVAFPQDALAAGTNPAGIAFLEHRFDAGIGLFNPNRKYTVRGAPSGFPTTFGLAPGTVESDSTLFVVPNFGGVWERPGGSVVGLALYGQGGMNTDYPARTFFGSRPAGVDLSQLFIAPTWARQFGSGRHAIGVSPILAYQTFEARGLQAFGNFSSSPANLTNRGHDTSTGFGARIGYLGRLSDRFAFGISYQTEISMEEFDNYAGLFADRGGFDIPSNLTVGIAVDVGETGVFLLDVQEINYSDVSSVNNPFLPNLVLAPLGAPNAAGFGWQDMTVVKTGFQWGGDPWTWRLGFSTGDQPIPPSEVLFNILAPGVVEDHITAGFTRALGRGELNVSFLYAPSVSVVGPNPLEVPGFQTIEIEMDQFDLEVGYSWGF